MPLHVEIAGTEMRFQKPQAMEDPYMVYHLSVRETDTGVGWITTKRYNDFLELKWTLESKFDYKKHHFPDFPRRRITSTFETTVINERKQKFQSYIAYMLQDSDVCHSIALKAFLANPSPVVQAPSQQPHPSSSSPSSSYAPIGALAAHNSYVVAEQPAWSRIRPSQQQSLPLPPSQALVRQQQQEQQQKPSISNGFQPTPLSPPPVSAKKSSDFWESQEEVLSNNDELDDQLMAAVRSKRSF